MLAHGVHYAVLAVGALGLLVLLGPSLAPSRPRAAYDEHDRRVQALLEQLAPAVPTRPPARVSLVPIAVVSSAAAAGVHTAVGPAHFREQLLFGLFFAGSALAQLGWSLAMTLRPTRALLVAAVIGNSAVLLLWLATRTTGLPGVLPAPEAVGTWDLACAGWELVVVLTCVRLLREGSRLRRPLWTSWEPNARAWAVGSVVVLGVLALHGGGG